MQKLMLLVLTLMTVSCLGSSPNSCFYTLKSYSDVSEYNLKTIIGVASIHVSDYLDKPQIVTSRKNGVEFDISEFNRWVEPLSFIIQRTLVNDLSAALPKSVVKEASGSREDINYIVSADVLQFDGVFDGEAVLDVRWSVQRNDGMLLLDKRSRFETSVGKTYYDLVMAESRLVNDWAQQIAGLLAGKK